MLFYIYEKNWQEDWNGDIELWNADLTCRQKNVAPLFNRAVIFHTNGISLHGMSIRVKCPEGEFHKSLACYYVTDLDSDKFPNEYRYKAVFLNDVLEKKIHEWRNCTLFDLIVELKTKIWKKSGPNGRLNCSTDVVSFKNCCFIYNEAVTKITNIMIPSHNNDTLTCVDLFSGIGGIAMGLKATSAIKTIAYCEINPYCQSVLVDRMMEDKLDKALIHSDIKTPHLSDGPKMLCGGFPCTDMLPIPQSHH